MSDKVAPYQVYYGRSPPPPPGRVKKRSNLAICCLAILAIVFLIAALAILIAWAVTTDGFKTTGSCSPSKSSSIRKDYTTSERDVCTSRTCVEISSKIIQNIDEGVSPCDDFFRFACGRYSESRVVPDDQLRVNILGEMGGNLNRRLKFLLESDQVETKETARKAKIYYQSCMNTEAIDELGLKPFNELIDSFGGWPLLPGVFFDEFSYKWEVQAANMFNRLGSQPIFQFGLQRDMKNNKDQLLEFAQIGLSLGSPKYYLNPDGAATLEVFKKFITDIAQSFGADPATVGKDADDLISFETEMAKICTTDEEMRNVSSSYNPMTWGEFNRRFTGIDWDTYQKLAFGNFLTLTNSQRVNVLNMKFFQGLATVLIQTPKRVLANYNIWRLVSNMLPYMPKEYRRPALELEKAFSGITQEPSRWKECVGATSGIFTWAMSGMYVDRYFNSNAKKEAKLVMDYLKRVAARTLEQADWMDSLSRELALKKLRFMNDKTAYPDYLSNETKILEPYKNVRLSPDAYFQNTLAMARSLREFEFSKFGKPLDKSEWQGTVIQANAYYSWLNNEMVFPGGILQPPMFTIGAPKYVNFGSAGFVVGHELTHGYDDQGSKFDHEGNLNSWWGKETERNFASKTQCFVYQYGNITDPVSNIRLNGYLTLGENIADNGAIRMAYSAYQLWKSDRQFGAEELILPGLEKYTTDQLFFLSFADSWCEITRPSAVEMLILADEHCMAPYRVNVPLQNFPIFAQTFGCSPGTKMNPSLKCKIW